MNWIPITPDTLPPVGASFVLWDAQSGTWDVAERESGLWATMARDYSELPPRYTHWAIPAPPGAPPTVPEEVRKVLEVDLTQLSDAAIALSNYRSEDAAAKRARYIPYIDSERQAIRDHIDAIRAARRVLGMDAEKQEAK